ncbi:retrotransposon protein, putative, ty1-copia subclass [Tanacetum coccineum]
MELATSLLLLTIFSRYGYVYLLKHKHEVFETFKVFQKEVENQLGKTIKSLRSDRGGEYMSQEFLDHLKEHGIIAHRTPPYTHQNMGVRGGEIENHCSTWSFRSMMSQNSLPKSFWDYALETCYTHFSTWFHLRRPYENKVFVARNAVFFESTALGSESNVGSVGRSWNVRKKWLFKKMLTWMAAVYIFKAHIRAIRILRSIAGLKMDYEIFANGLSKTAFLNGHLSEEVYMEQPEGEAAYILGIKIYRDSRFQQNPGEEHWTAVKNILKYLRNTKDMFLVYGGNLKRQLRVSCYTDAGYLTDADYLTSQDWIFVRSKRRLC